MSKLLRHCKPSPDRRLILPHKGSDGVFEDDPTVLRRPPQAGFPCKLSNHIYLLVFGDFAA